MKNKRLHGYFKSLRIGRRNIGYKASGYDWLKVFRNPDSDMSNFEIDSKYYLDEILEKYQDHPLFVAGYNLDPKSEHYSEFVFAPQYLKEHEEIFKNHLLEEPKK